MRTPIAALVAGVLSAGSAQAGSQPMRGRQGMVASQNFMATPDRRGRAVGRRQRRGRRGGHRLRPGRHPSRRRQHRRRRVPALPAREGRGRGLRLPRGGARGHSPDHVPEGRQIRRRPPSRQPLVGRGAGHGGRAAHGLEGARKAALAAPGGAGGRAGPRGLHGDARAGALAGRRAAAHEAATPRRSPSSAAPACPTSRATCCSRRTWRGRCERIADKGPAGLLRGRDGGADREGDGAGRRASSRAPTSPAYRPRKRTPLRGTYRGYEVLAMPPISSGGTALLQMLNVLEGYDLKERGLRQRRDRPPDGGDHAPRLRGPRALPGRSGVQPRACPVAAG